MRELCPPGAVTSHPGLTLLVRAWPWDAPGVRVRKLPRAPWRRGEVGLGSLEGAAWGQGASGPRPGSAGTRQVQPPQQTSESPQKGEAGWLAVRPATSHHKVRKSSPMFMQCPRERRKSNKAER